MSDVTMPGLDQEREMLARLMEVSDDVIKLFIGDFDAAEMLAVRRTLNWMASAIRFRIGRVRAESEKPVEEPRGTDHRLLMVIQEKAEELQGRSGVPESEYQAALDYIVHMTREWRAEKPEADDPRLGLGGLGTRVAGPVGAPLFSSPPDDAGAGEVAK